jgi:hypothetical protein
MDSNVRNRAKKKDDISSTDIIQKTFEYEQKKLNILSKNSNDPSEAYKQLQELIGQAKKDKIPFGVSLQDIWKAVDVDKELIDKDSKDFNIDRENMLWAAYEIADAQKFEDGPKKKSYLQRHPLARTIVNTILGVATVAGIAAAGHAISDNGHVDPSDITHFSYESHGQGHFDLEAQLDNGEVSAHLINTNITGDLNASSVDMHIEDGVVQSNITGHLTNGNFYGSYIGQTNGTFNANITGGIEGVLNGTTIGDFNGSINGAVSGLVNGYYNGTIDGNVTGYLAGVIHRANGTDENVDGFVGIDLNGARFEGEMKNATVNGTLAGNVVGQINAKTDANFKAQLNNTKLQGVYAGIVNGSMNGGIDADIEAQMIETYNGDVKGSMHGDISARITEGDLEGILSGRIHGTGEGYVEMTNEVPLAPAYIGTGIAAGAATVYTHNKEKREAKVRFRSKIYDKFSAYISPRKSKESEGITLEELKIKDYHAKK